MRLLRLVRAAFDAEGLYLRRVARARVIQAELAAVAALFALLLVLMLHIAAFAALIEGGWRPVGAALLIGVGDLVLAGIFALAASRAGHDAVADEALEVRNAAMRQIGDGAARAVMLAPLLRSQSAKKGLFGAALTALAVGLMSRR
jgi:hypothetical protein